MSHERMSLNLQLGSIESDAHAMQLIEGFVFLNHPPPSILYPYVIKAIDSWGRTKGNKCAYTRAIKRQATPDLNMHYMQIICGEIEPPSAPEAEIIQTLKECIRLISNRTEYELPAALLPYVSLAVDAWGQTKGNKLAYKDISGDWDELVWLVHFYFVTAQRGVKELNSSGGEVDKREITILGDAIDRVIEERPTVAGTPTTFSTLKRYYDNADSRITKEDVEKRHGRIQRA